MSMLSRVAENLFWIGRYVERAENTARLLDTARRMGALPGPEGNRNEWASILASSGSDYCFPEDASPYSPEDVIHHLSLADYNPSSICSSIKNARGNARATRSGISSDIWRATNGLYLELKELARRPVPLSQLADLIERTKLGCMSIVGAIDSTALRDETYDFIRLGTFIERADSTARILDVKYFSLLPPEEAIEGGVDTYQWQTILDSTSTRRHFRRLYGTNLRASTVAELLIHNDDCARSLVYSIETIEARLAHIGETYSTDLKSLSAAKQVLSGLTSHSADDIIVSGFHEFLSAFIRSNNALARQIGLDFYFIAPTETPETSFNPAGNAQSQA